MKYKLIILWISLLALTAALFSGCDGRQNPTVPQTIPETVPTTVAATMPPVETAAPTEPQPTQPDPIPVELTPEARHEINVFLSNFSEQWFHEDFIWFEDAASEQFLSSQAGIPEILGFAWLHAKIHFDSELEVVTIDEDSYYSFSLSLLDSISQRFFGRALTEADLTTLGSEYYFLLDSQVCGPATDGESYMNITVTESMYDLLDGTIQAEFSIYDAWEFFLSDSKRDPYTLTSEQAQNDPALALHLKGVAVLRPHTLGDGQASHQLVSYELYAPDS